MPTAKEILRTLKMKKFRPLIVPVGKRKGGNKVIIGSEETLDQALKELRTGGFRVGVGGQAKGKNPSLAARGGAGFIAGFKIVGTKKVLTRDLRVVESKLIKNRKIRRALEG